MMTIERLIYIAPQKKSLTYFSSSEAALCRTMRPRAAASYSSSGRPYSVLFSCVPYHWSTHLFIWPIAQFICSFFLAHLKKIICLPKTLVRGFNEQLMELFVCRIRRKFSRGLKRKPMALIKKLRKKKKEAPANEKPDVVKTHLRNMVIVPEMTGSIVGVYN